MPRRSARSSARPLPGRSEQLDPVADRDLARSNDAGEHPALLFELGLQAGTSLLHAAAGVAHHRDLEFGGAHAQALADRPHVDVSSLDGEVLSDPAGLHADRAEVVRRDKEHLALPTGARMRAAFETVPFDRPRALLPGHPAAVLLRRGPDMGDLRHTPSLVRAPELVQRDRPRDG